jgi:hypothetical protein
VTITADPLDQPLEATSRRRPAGGWVAAGALATLAIGAGLALPDVTGDPGAMTHYMGLLADNQPWNLILFMAIPVILAETLAITELVILYTQGHAPRWVHALSRGAGLIAGPWFLAITTYLLVNAVGPLTAGSGWNGPADVIAVGAYLAGVVPLVGITLIELGILGRGTDRARMRLHATFVGVFLVVAHVAMIFGMLDPTLLGWDPADTMHTGHMG